MDSTTLCAFPMIAKSGWYREIVNDGVCPDLPGLYEWRIEEVGCYIGQYTNVRRPRREYDLNVRRILAGHHYRKGNPDGFRQIHKELAKAAADSLNVTLTLLENVISKSDRNSRERDLIKARCKDYEETRFRILNSSR